MLSEGAERQLLPYIHYRAFFPVAEVVAPDQKTILFSKSVTSGADMMMIENFQ